MNKILVPFLLVSLLADQKFGETHTVETAEPILRGLPGNGVSLQVYNEYTNCFEFYNVDEIDPDQLSSEQKVIFKTLLGEDCDGDPIIEFDDTMVISDYEATQIRRLQLAFMKGKLQEWSGTAMASTYRTRVGMLQEQQNLTTKFVKGAMLRGLAINGFGQHTLISVDGRYVEGVTGKQVAKLFGKDRVKRVAKLFKRAQGVPHYNRSTRVLRPIGGQRTVFWSQIDENISKQTFIDNEGNIEEIELEGYTMIQGGLLGKAMDVEADVGLQDQTFQLIQRSKDTVKGQFVDYSAIAGIVGNNTDLFQQQGAVAK